MGKVELVKAIIEQSGSKFVSVTFKKKDGTLRTIVHNKAVHKGIKGELASESAKQAVATRKANNPNLISVFDSQLAAKGEKAEKCWRSINCDTVVSVRCNGEEIEFK